MANNVSESAAFPVVPLRNDEHYALRQVRSPIRARRVAKLLVVIFFVTAIALVFVPWQQSLVATGRVTAFDPTLREQVIEAPVTGRVVKVHVVEGQHVKGRKVDENGRCLPGKEGTLLVSIRDPDPELVQRLQEKYRALQQKLEAARKQRQSLAAQAEALDRARNKALDAAQNRVEMSKQREMAAKELVVSSRAAAKLADYQYQQQSKLLNDGLTSELEFQQSARQQLAAKADLNRADLTSIEAGISVLALQADFDKVRQDFEASIRSVLASREKVDADIASIDSDIASLNVQISRQGTQDVYAPCDGTVFRVLTRSAGGGTVVQAGKPLISLVPEIPEKQRVVELFVDGNDAPLITELWLETYQMTGEKPHIPVRLQFEGYPAIQWVGWPSAAVGTFGGIIDFVDQTDDGYGRFRILVRRDPAEEKENPWPDGFALRQGVRTTGWVLLHRVPLGWEMWRRLNGFPPVVAEDPAKRNKDKPAVLKALKPK